MMLRFHKDEVQPKGFFSLQSGYNEWETLNNQYQAKSITFLRGWNRALINFAGKLRFSMTCASNIFSVFIIQNDMLRMQVNFAFQ